MEKENEIVEKLRAFLKDMLTEAKIPKERRIFVQVKREALKDAIKYLVNELKFRHLSTITGVDIGEKIEVIYHLAYKGSIELSLKVSLPKENPSIPTVMDCIPGAVLYEREVHDLLGVNFEGHPDLSSLLLPEGWPEGLYPLRKEPSLEKIRDMISER